jgi:putative tryptophan/tyrosine transport system substrate-binding protein
MREKVIARLIERKHLVEDPNWVRVEQHFKGKSEERTRVTQRKKVRSWFSGLFPTNALAETQSKDLLAAARSLGLELHILHASTERDFETAFAALIKLRAGGLMIGTDGFFVSRSEQLAALTVSHAIPAIFQYRAFVEAGGLMSYGGSVTESYRLSGVYTGRILKGEKPADLPVQQATKVELIINLKTARALGLNIPLPLIARADGVIE